jgi:transcriptional regulator with XRE-family HTH domain
MQKTKNMEAANRIKVVRMMTGMSRKSFQEATGISANTLRAWESAKNPLSQKAALKLSFALEKTGIICSSEWLFDGLGPTPKFQKNSTSQDIAEKPMTFNDEFAIQKEILTFTECNPDPEIIIVQDDTMEPQYMLGDYVGVKNFIARDTFDDLLKENCVIETIDKEVYIRKLLKSSHSGCYSLYGINYHSNGNLIILDKKVVRAAKIIWHRKKQA